MNFSLETIAKIYAQGRNYINSGLGALVMFGALTAAQQKSVMEGLSDIAAGLSQAFTGASHIWQVGLIVLGPLLTAYLAKKAGNAASTQGQKNSLIARANEPDGPGTEAKAAVLDAATKLPGVEIDGAIKAPPAVASAVPSPQVVSK